MGLHLQTQMQAYTLVFLKNQGLSELSPGKIQNLINLAETIIKESVFEPPFRFGRSNLTCILDKNGLTVVSFHRRNANTRSRLLGALLNEFYHKWRKDCS